MSRVWSIYQPANDDALELLDGLGQPVVEDLEVVLNEIGDRRAISGGKHVDPDVVRLRAERGLRRVLYGLAGAGHDVCRRGHQGHQHHRAARNPTAPHRIITSADRNLSRSSG
jgi:hypothetical protein